MKVKVEYTVEISDAHRKSINFCLGKKGLADRATVKEWLQKFGETNDEDTMCYRRQVEYQWWADYRNV